MNRIALPVIALLVAAGCSDAADESDYTEKMMLCAEACEQRAETEGVEITLWKCDESPVICSCVAPGEEPCVDTFMP